MKAKILFALSIAALLIFTALFTYLTVKYFTYENLVEKSCSDYAIEKCPQECVVSAIAGIASCHVRE